MNKIKISQLKADAEMFMSYLKLKSKPQIFFVDKANFAECIVNDFFPKGNAIYFNIGFLEKLTFDYTCLLIAHEIYHYSKQGIKEKNDVLEMKYNHVWSFMQLYDVEADFKVASFFQYKFPNSSFKDYIKVLYNGAGVFKNETIRLVKLERFIGSMVSIKALFENGQKIILLPKLNLNHISLVVVDFTENKLFFDTWQISSNELEKWKIAFQDAIQFSQSEYGEMLNTMSSNLLTKINYNLYEAQSSSIIT